MQNDHRSPTATSSGIPAGFGWTVKMVAEEGKYGYEPTARHQKKTIDRFHTLEWSSPMSQKEPAFIESKSNENRHHDR